MFLRTSIVFPLVLVTSLGLASPAAAASGGANGQTQRVSLTEFGTQVFNAAYEPSVSRDGSRVAFHTQAALVVGDTNGTTDVYVFDRTSYSVTLVSTSTSGTLGNSSSYEAAISGDGQWVAFSTYATNLYGFDTNGLPDVMLKNLATGSLTRVSALVGSIHAASGESRRAALSYDGRFVAFDTTGDIYSAEDTNDDWDVYLRDMQQGTIQLVSRAVFGGAGNSGSVRASVSDNGRYVCFSSASTNFSFGDANGTTDVFVRDVAAGATSLVSRVPGGAQGNDSSWQPSMSADGQRVAFATYATNFVFGDTNGRADVYVVDRAANTLRLMSGAPAGGFTSDGGSEAHISADGSTVVFTSAAPEITSDASPFLSTYVRNIERGVTRLASRPTGPDGQPDGPSRYPAVNGDGSVVVFDSTATNLVAGDVNLTKDIFARVLYADPVVYCTASITSAGCEPRLASSGLPRAGHDSGFVVSCTDAPNNKFGLLFYGLGGRLDTPFLAGTFCVQAPVVRTAPAFSAGNPVTVDDCSGSFQIDMNAFAEGLLGVAPLVELGQIGTRVNVQYWGRDPQGPIASTFLSNALEYVVGP
jgi:dipeptidyl aminopeptidase/acylaminoacyl peptidase